LFSFRVQNPIGYNVWHGLPKSPPEVSLWERLGQGGKTGCLDIVGSLHRLFAFHFFSLMNTTFCFPLSLLSLPMMSGMHFISFSKKYIDGVCHESPHSHSIIASGHVFPDLLVKKRRRGAYLISLKGREPFYCFFSSCILVCCLVKIFELNVLVPQYSIRADFGFDPSMVSAF
jgi:hypothetical protein